MMSARSVVHQHQADLIFLINVFKNVSHLGGKVHGKWAGVTFPVGVDSLMCHGGHIEVVVLRSIFHLSKSVHF